MAEEIVLKRRVYIVRLELANAGFPPATKLFANSEEEAKQLVPLLGKTVEVTSTFKVVEEETNIDLLGEPANDDQEVLEDNVSGKPPTGSPDVA
jgi:hypothetical protein